MKEENERGFFFVCFSFDENEEKNTKIAHKNSVCF